MVDRSPSPWISVSFTPTLDDVAVYLRHLAACSRQFQDTYQRNRRLGWLIAAAVLAPLLVATVASKMAWGAWLDPYLRYGLPFMLAACAMLFLGIKLCFGFSRGPAGMVAKTLESQARSGALETDLRPCVVWIDASGLHVDKGTSRFWHSWATIQRIDESEARLIVFYLRDQGVVVPVTAFDPPGAAAEFKRLIETNMRRAAGASSAPPTIGAKV